MPNIYGQQSTLSATDSALHINIEDTIGKYPDWQFPLLKRWSSKVFKADVKSHKYEWTEKELRPVTAKVASATVASNATTFYVDTAGVFNVDDVLQKPDGEQVIVTAVTGGTLLTVEALSGTPETMVLGETVKRIGVASPQGKDADNMVIAGTDDLYNYTQIFEDVVEMSGTQRNSMIHGDENSAALIEDKQKELMEVLQTTLLIGNRTINKEQKRTTTGGLKYFIDTYAPENAIDFGGATTWNTAAGVKTKIDDAIEKIANNMGGKPTIVLGFKAMRKLKDLADGTVFTKTTDKTRGTAMPEQYLSQLGALDIVMLRERSGVMDNLIFIIDEEQCGFKAMKNRGWFTEELAKVGDSYKWQVLGEYIAKFATPKVQAYIYNLGL
jgi:hypothetical protein